MPIGHYEALCEEYYERVVREWRRSTSRQCGRHADLGCAGTDHLAMENLFMQAVLARGGSLDTDTA
jgi:hypothetical protein